MRRKEKKISKRQTIDEIICMSTVYRPGLAKNNIPYIVPVSFGYDGENIYFHTGAQGRKIEFIESNNTVCLEFEGEIKLLPAKSASKWTFAFKSVIGYGRIYEITELQDRIAALNHIMRKYSHSEGLYKTESLKSMRVWKIEINHISGKQSKFDKPL
ncbi:pyridoxamine 5'-phosphate oxidase family protein [Candidatus Riflebacteria bacterium]